ncbi:MAG: FtsX-like permease family protein [Treponema sp.]|nr:FtsX-like permease family protein [Treponema sp.]
MIAVYVLRSITRNARNSVIIIILIAVISFLFFLGNSVIGRADRQLRGSYVDSLTADVVIQKKTGTTMNLFGANVPVIDNRFTIPTLSAYNDVARIVAGETGVAGFTSQISLLAGIDAGENYREGVLVCGADPSSYFTLFPGLIIDEGGPLEAGSYGTLITAERARQMEEATGIYPRIGDTLVFVSAGNVGFKIREIPLRGIFHYRNPGDFMDGIVIMDPQTARVLSSIQVATSDVAVPDDAVELLSPLNIDDIDVIFGGVSESGGEAPGPAEYSAPGTVDEDGVFNIDELQAFLASPASSDGGASAEGGDWNFILIRAKQGYPVNRLIANLNKKLEAYGAVAVNWREAAGQSAIMLLLLQSLFNAGVFLISVAGILVVVNILLIAVFRRTREIGTLRAIGAGDAYIRVMILSENIFLSALAGFAGVAAGSWLFRVINKMRITIPNDLIAGLLGGRSLTMEFIPSIALLTLAVAVFLGFAASIFPVETAVRIDPVTAVQQG